MELTEATDRTGPGTAAVEFVETVAEQDTVAFGGTARDMVEQIVVGTADSTDLQKGTELLLNCLQNCSTEILAYTKFQHRLTDLTVAFKNLPNYKLTPRLHKCVVNLKKKKTESK